MTYQCNHKNPTPYHTHYGEIPKMPIGRCDKCGGVIPKMNKKTKKSGEIL